ncbi:hypothetical protein B9Z55_002703 [Caenorhabditis nigoni]|nr:hypothetical protein B9Z55_002702 [Caenorhabditis nigoni]PIC52712.1 hypothetical protein B9Z55_002703 [Caenorhabditis nigoni]
MDVLCGMHSGDTIRERITFNAGPHNFFTIGIGRDIRAEKQLRRTIDNLWFDAEGEEFGNDFFDIFYQNGIFDQNKIDVCQINIEIHITSDVPNRKREFMKFLKRIIQEKRYGVYFGDAYGNIRMYMFNYGSPYSVEKF